MKVKLLSRVRLLATPWTAAHQAPPSMGFSRQEYWSGVPLPSPVHISTIVVSYVVHNNNSLCLLQISFGAVTQSCPTLRAHGLQPPRVLYPWDSPGKNTGVGFHFFLQRIFPTQGSNPRLLRLLHWQVRSLPLAPQGSPFFDI